MIDQSSLLKDAFLALDKLQKQVNQYNESIAIVGMSCRFPGGIDSPDAFWQMLKEGDEVISEVPFDRWQGDAFYDADPEKKGKMYSKRAGFLNHIDHFDAEFFAISPREAMDMDPQQRLLLEVSWEALERAGAIQERLSGSKTGVFVGITTSDHAQIRMGAGQLEQLGSYDISGNTLNTAAGRLSYQFGFHGPSLAIDTACSSSLVAIHQACQSLRQNECEQALAAGVNLMLTPVASVALCETHALSPTGHCCAFDEQANGMVRGEGCAVLVLKRLSVAQKNNDNILAVIRGSAVNHDGPSSALMVPNGTAQEHLLKQALDNAKVSADQVDYVEAHGTGTPLGDPIEAKALNRVYSSQREADHPLWVGSVKTNMGHLEACAGIAGVMKVILALQHKQIPAHLHFKRPSSYIDWQSSMLKIPTYLQDWPHYDASAQKSALAGISAFGFSGTNAHLIVEEAPNVEISTLVSANATSTQLFSLSAQTKSALQLLAKRYAQHLLDESVQLQDVCFTANTGRATLACRLAISATSTAELSAALLAIQPDDISTIDNPLSTVKIAFLFTGQGSQYVGMASELYQAYPIFRRYFDQCDAILARQLGHSLRDLIFVEDNLENADTLQQTLYAQPAIFVVEYALAMLWQSWGVRPSAMMGHSIGEYVAACIAGVFSLDDALTLVVARARLMQALPQNGAMLAVLADQEKIAGYLQAETDKVSIAAINGSHNLVLSGEQAAIELISQQLSHDGISNKRLSVSHAFHSALMDSILDDFYTIAQQIEYKKPQITLISNLTGKAISEGLTTASYWCRHLRETVQFAAGIDCLQQLNYGVLLEIGAKPTLSAMAVRGFAKASSPICVASLRQNENDQQVMLASLGALYCAGVVIDWSGFYQHTAYRRVVLPVYPFAKTVYGIDAEKVTQQFLSPANPHHTNRLSQSENDTVHPLLGKALYFADADLEDKVPTATQAQTWHFQAELEQNSPRFLAHHRIFQWAVFPATAYLEMIFAASQDVLQQEDLCFQHIRFQKALILPEKEKVKVQLSLKKKDNDNDNEEGDSDDGYYFKIFSHEQSQSGHWIEHVRGDVVQNEQSHSSDEGRSLTALKQHFQREVSVKAHYQQCADNGVHFGVYFQALKHLYTGENEALGKIVLPNALAASAERFYFHPVLMDAGLQVLNAIKSATMTKVIEQGGLYLPVHIKNLKYYKKTEKSLWCHAVLKENASNKEMLTVDFHFFNQAGEKLADIDALQLKRSSQNSLLRMIEGEAEQRTTRTISIADDFYKVVWRTQAYRAALENGDLQQPKVIQQALLPTLPSLYSGVDLEGYWLTLQQLERYSVLYVLNALQTLGWNLQHTLVFSVSDMMKKLTILDQHKCLFVRLLSILAEENILQRIDHHSTNTTTNTTHATNATDAVFEEQWRLPLPLEKTVFFQHYGNINLKQLPEHLLAKSALAAAELTLLHRCGLQLAAVLQGRVDPLPLLFAENKKINASSLYKDSPGAKILNQVVHKTVEKALSQWPKKRVLRILEIGAGTGGTTTGLLPYLPADRTEYVFSDISPQFMTEAESKFKDYSFLTYQTLNIEQSPCEQGFSKGHFDIILAANVIHATADLQRSVKHIRQLLAPNGLFILLEGTAPIRLIDIIFGLTEGWWRFSDQLLRPDHPLLSALKWQQLLKQEGFADVVSINDESVLFSKQAIIVAKNSAKQCCLSPDADELLKSKDKIRSWLILDDDLGLGEALSDDLQALGDCCIRVRQAAGKDYEQVSAEEFVLVADNGEHWQRLFIALAQQKKMPTDIIQLWALHQSEVATLSAGDLLAMIKAHCNSSLLLVQAINKTFIELPALWFVTQAAQTVTKTRETVDLVQTPLWGFAKVLALEYPHWRSTCIDLDGSIHPVEQRNALLKEIDIQSTETQVALRNDARYVARLTRQKDQQHDKNNEDHQSDIVLKEQSTLNFKCKADRSYLITGGLQGLGLLIAEQLVQQGALHLVLLGRSLPNKESLSVCEELRAKGVEVKVFQTDVTDFSRMQQLMDDIQHSMPPLAGIVHSAGVLSDAVLEKQNWQSFEAVMLPKVVGAWHLHHLSRDLPLDFFVLFSSVASLWGSPSQANHALSNTFLDALAHYRRANDLVASSINWGAWSEVGAAANQITKERIKKKGLMSLSPKQGCEAFQQVLSQGFTQVAVVPINWSRFIKNSLSDKSVFFAELIAQNNDKQSKNNTIAAKPDPSQSLLENIHQADGDERLAFLMGYVQAKIAFSLRLPVAKIKSDHPMTHMGVDSLMAVEIKNGIQKDLHIDIAVVYFLEGATVTELAAKIDTKLTKLRVAEQTNADVHSSKSTTFDNKENEIGVRQTQAMLETLDELSDAEIDALLADVLADEEKG